MVSVLEDVKGSVFIEFLLNGHNINGEYYEILWSQVRNATKNKRLGKAFYLIKTKLQ